MSLPIERIFNELSGTLEQHSRVILQAPPGAGKSTRLPLLLLQNNRYSTSHQIILLEPRRVAARQIAEYLAKQLQQKVGQTIGLKMRGESKVSDETILTIVTDGVMVRQIQSDPELNNIGLLIFDEFHERALQTDLALALALDAQSLNDDVNVLIMSATLDLQKLSKQLDAPIVESSGRQFPVDVHYVTSAIMPSDDDVLKAINLALSEQNSSILVFLSGVGEIKRLQQKLQDKVYSDDIEVLPLYGGLSIEQQVNAIKPCQQGQRKIVLATNIAQTSLTIEGIDVVVDSGIERVVQFNHKLGAEQLISQPISIAAAIQRAGRAGRLRAGVCYRLGNKEQFQRRRQFDVAEIERVDLAQLMLEVEIWGCGFDELFWLSKPSERTLQLARNKLLRLGYLTQSNKDQGRYVLTELANHYQTLPLGLRFSKMLLSAEQLIKTHNLNREQVLTTACILVAYMQQIRGSEQINVSSALMYLSQTHWHLLTPQFSALAHRLKLAKPNKNAFNVDYVSILLALAYPDRIGKWQGKQWKLSNGAGVTFHSSHVATEAEFIVVTDFNASDYGQFISQYVDLELSEIERYLPELLEQKESVLWSDKKQKPERLQQQVIGELVLNQKPLTLELSADEWQQLWLDTIVIKGWQALTYSDELDVLLTKLQLAKQSEPHLEWPTWNKQRLVETVSAWLSPYLSNIRDLKQLKTLNLAKILLDSLDWNLQQQLASLCPDRYQTPAGSERKIDYQNHEPKLSVKLQEMFGEPTTPTICNGKVLLTLELLSPAQRPLQLTKDLANFWQNAYQEVKKEMKGRYPKHPWPDDPTSFVATSKTKSQLAKNK